jgi:iron complex transport system permease protein
LKRLKILKTYPRFLCFLVFLLGAMSGIALYWGSTDLSKSSWELFGRVRVLRVALAAVAGASLAVSGVLMQGLFRNPLASPSILGVNSGAIFGGQFALLFYYSFKAYFGVNFPETFILPCGIFLGAGLVLLLLLFFLRFFHTDSRDLLMLLLVGVMLGNFFTALAGCITVFGINDWALQRSILSMAYGSLDGKGLDRLLLAIPLFLGAFLAALCWARPLDLLLSGEEEALAFGLSVRQTQTWVLIWSAVFVTVAIVVGGGATFVGLVIPHLLRLFTGPTHLKLIPASALVGATFLIACDWICRLPAFASQGELPLSTVTAILGAPLFLYLFLKEIPKNFY